MKKIFLLACLAVCTLGQSKNKEWTCINESGQAQFKIEAMRIGEFCNGLAKVYKNTYVNNTWVTGYGFVNSTGEITIPCNLKVAQDFTAPVTWVKYSGDEFFTLIDKMGNKVESKPYKKVGQFYNAQTDICPVFEGNAMGFVNRLGQEIIPCRFLGGAIFQYNLLSVCDALESNSMYGFINKAGETVIPLKFKQAGSSSFQNGLARAQLNNETVLVDTLGNVVFKTKKGTIQGYSNGLVMVFINRTERTGYGWLNLKNEFVINPIYDDAENFNANGWAVVSLNGKKGLIDKTGKIKLDLIYKDLYANYEQDGYIMVVYPSKEELPLSLAKKDYLNESLEIVSLPLVSYIYPKRNGEFLPFKSKAGLFGYLDQNYKIVIEPTFKKANAFSNGFAWVYN